MKIQDNSSKDLWNNENNCSIHTSACCFVSTHTRSQSLTLFNYRYKLFTIKLIAFARDTRYVKMLSADNVLSLSVMELVMKIIPFYNCFLEIQRSISGFVCKVKSPHYSTVIHYPRLTVKQVTYKSFLSMNWDK